MADRLPLYGCLAAAGAFTFAVLFKSSESVLGGLNRRYQWTLTQGDVSTLAMRFVSTIQALVAISLGVCVTNTVDDIVYGMFPYLNEYASFAGSYFLYDTYAMYYCYKRTTHNNTSSNTDRVPSTVKSVAPSVRTFLRVRGDMVAHHIVGVILMWPCILVFRGDKGDGILGMLMLSEISNPFLSLRAVLKQLGLSSTRFYMVNGILMLLAFFVFRILLIPYIYWTYAVYSNLPVYMVPLTIPKHCNLSCVLLLLPQVYWLYLMLRGLSRYTRRLLTNSDNTSKTRYRQQHLNNGYSNGKTK